MSKDARRRQAADDVRDLQRCLEHWPTLQRIAVEGCAGLPLLALARHVPPSENLGRWRTLVDDRRLWTLPERFPFPPNFDDEMQMQHRMALQEEGANCYCFNTARLHFGFASVDVVPGVRHHRSSEATPLLQPDAQPSNVHVLLPGIAPSKAAYVARHVTVRGETVVSALQLSAMQCVWRWCAVTRLALLTAPLLVVALIALNGFKINAIIGQPWALDVSWCVIFMPVWAAVALPALRWTWLGARLLLSRSAPEQRVVYWAMAHQLAVQSRCLQTPAAFAACVLSVLLQVLALDNCAVPAPLALCVLVFLLAAATTASYTLVSTARADPWSDNVRVVCTLTATLVGSVLLVLQAMSSPSSSEPRNFLLEPAGRWALFFAPASGVLLIWLAYSASLWRHDVAACYGGTDPDLALPDLALFLTVAFVLTGQGAAVSALRGAPYSPLGNAFVASIFGAALFRTAWLSHKVLQVQLRATFHTGLCLVHTPHIASNAQEPLEAAELLRNSITHEHIHAACLAQGERCVFCERRET
jgi:hypothetical protein